MHVQGSSDWVRGVCIALLALVLASPAFAQRGRLSERLTPQVMAVVYPDGADRLGVEEGEPPAIAVYKGDKIVAYVFSTLDIIRAPGYSTTPFDVIAGIDLSGRITGAKVVFHNEPFIVHDPIRQRLLDTFLAREAGRPLSGATNLLPPDYVAGASVSARAMRAGVLATARLVLRPRIARGPATVATLDVDSFRMKSFPELIAEGAVTRRRVTSGDVAAALAARGASNTKLDWPLGRDDDTYIEFMTALVTPPAIGGNLLGMIKLEDYKSGLPNGAQAIFIASNGPYDFFGRAYVQASQGNRFDRIRVVQDGKTFRFVQADYTYAVPPQGQQLAGLFKLPANAGFDPLKPWRLDILVNSESGPPVSVAFGLDYKVPDSFVTGAGTAAATLASAPAAKAAEPAEIVPQLQPELDLALETELESSVPAWIEAWTDAKVNIAILTVLLTVLTLIFVFQDALARHRRAHLLVRRGFLLVVLVWLGWTASVQLSIVNVMNYAMAPFNRFDIGFYLAEPLMVIIAAYTADIATVDRTRRVLRLALPVRGAAGTARSARKSPARAAMESPGRARAASVDGQVHRRRGRPDFGDIGDRPGRRHARGRAVQDRDHGKIRAWLALRGLRRRTAGDRAILGARLLPLPLSARRRARRPRSAASSQSPQAPARMRQSLPSLRTLVPRARDRADRQDRHRGMFPVPRLSGRIF